MYFIAFLFPGISFLLRGKIVQGIVAIVLQISAVPLFFFFGLGFVIWICCAIWAILSINSERADKRTAKMTTQIQKNQNDQNKQS